MSKILNNSRAAIFVHYDRHSTVDDYIYFYLQELQKNSSHLIFVSTAKLSEDDVSTLSKYCSKVIIRENIGYDFMSYKIGLQSFDYQKYDEVLICNDSVYGPVYPLENIFNTMQHKECDFWGTTDNNDINYHLQSYFLVFRKNILNSQVFLDFWDSVKVLNNKNGIIKKYEVGLTQTLIKAGFSSQVYASFKPTNMQKMVLFVKKLTPCRIFKKIYAVLTQKSSIQRIGKLNSSHYFYKELLLVDKVPFIKIELLRDNPMNVNLDDVDNLIGKFTNYDFNLIKNHLSRVRAKK